MDLWFPIDANPVVCFSEVFFAFGAVVCLSLAVWSWVYRDATEPMLGGDALDT
jgi:hypothetical protein